MCRGGVQSGGSPAKCCSPIEGVQHLTHKTALRENRGGGPPVPETRPSDDILGLGQTQKSFILKTQMSHFVLTELKDRHLLHHNCIRRFGTESSTEGSGFHPNRRD